jgi:pimeloyl-ACP methyl ester carboxylesterase
MMPRVRFARSADGISIAFSTLGEGPPLVLMPAIPFSHLEKMWELPRLRQGLETLAADSTVVRYDSRGCGLSERSLDDYSLEAHLHDLEAVVDACGLDSFALNGPMIAGPVAIAYAARHPERVTRLVLQSTIARATDVMSAAAEGMLGLLEKDWVLFTETASRFALQWADEEMAREAAPLLRECVTQETALAIFRAAMEIDATEDLGRVRAPTLVIHNRQFPVDLAIARQLASRIPDARLAAVDDMESVIGAISDFVAPEPPAAQRGTDAAAPGPPAVDPLGLSAREIEVLRLVAAGKSNRQIAEELFISTNTVDRHVSHILSKIGAANRAEAAAYAAKQRLLS